MNVSCPVCRRPIPSEDVNVSTDVALCRPCGETYSLQALLADPGEINVHEPPPGAWYRETPDGFITGFNTRSWTSTILVAVCLVWIGGAISFYRTAAAESQSDAFSAIALFQTSFNVVIFAMVIAMATMGKAEVIRSGDRVKLFVGVGSLGWRREHAWSDFQAVREVSRSWSRPNDWFPVIIQLEGQARVSFPPLWNKVRRTFLVGVLRQALARR